MSEESDLPEAEDDRADDELKNDEPEVAFVEDSDPDDIHPARTRPSRPRVVSQPTRSGWLTTLSVGVGAGIVSVLLNTALTFLNLPIFQRAAAEGNNVQTNTAFALVGLQCLNFFLTLLICFGAGYLVSKLTLLRRPGIYAGALAAMLTYVVSFLVRYIPNYPGNLPGSATSVWATSGAILLTLIFLALWAVLGGLLGLWGAGIAIRPRRRVRRRRAW